MARRETTSLGVSWALILSRALTDRAEKSILEDFDSV